MDPPEATKTRIAINIREGRQDLLAWSARGLTNWLNTVKREYTDDEIDRICQFFMNLPEAIAIVAMRRLLVKGAPRGDYFIPKLMFWESPDGVKAGRLGEKFAAYTLSVTKEAHAERRKL